jgi:hypothetical protein
VHPFFGGVRWESLFRGRGPFLPEVKQDDGLSYFYNERTFALNEADELLKLPTASPKEGGTSGGGARSDLVAKAKARTTSPSRHRPPAGGGEQAAARAAGAKADGEGGGCRDRMPPPGQEQEGLAAAEKDSTSSPSERSAGAGTTTDSQGSQGGSHGYGSGRYGSSGRSAGSSGRRSGRYGSGRTGSQRGGSQRGGNVVVRPPPMQLESEVGGRDAGMAELGFFSRKNLFRLYSRAKMSIQKHRGSVGSLFSSSRRSDAWGTSVRERSQRGSGRHFGLPPSARSEFTGTWRSGRSMSSDGNESLGSTMSSTEAKKSGGASPTAGSVRTGHSSFGGIAGITPGRKMTSAGDGVGVGELRGPNESPPL